MRPHPDDLLRSLRESLVDVVIPAIEDDWARYVAKGMEKIIVHLEVRWREELEHVARDAAELDALLRDIVATLRADELRDLPGIARVAEEAAAPLDGPSPAAAPDIAALYAGQETRRAALVAVIAGLEQAASNPGPRAALEPLRDRIREHLMREIDRDAVLARPTYMLFGPPPASGGNGA